MLGQTNRSKALLMLHRSDITEANDLYDRAMLFTLSVEDVCSAGVLLRIKGKLDDLK